MIWFRGMGVSPMRFRAHCVGERMGATPMPRKLSAFTPGVGFAGDGAEVSAGLLFADPFQEGLKLGDLAEQIDSEEIAREVLVCERGVDLLVAGLAQGRAVLGGAAFFFW